MAMGIKAEIPAWISILIGLSAGTFIGAINGFLIGVVKITPLIATLASLSVVRAIAYIITDARPIYGLPMSFRIFGTGYIGPVPYAFILAIFVAMILLLVLKRTRVGRYTLAIGGNEEAARLSGVSLWKNKDSHLRVGGIMRRGGRAYPDREVECGGGVGGFWHGNGSHCRGCHWGREPGGGGCQYSGAPSLAQS